MRVGSPDPKWLKLKLIGQWLVWVPIDLITALIESPPEKRVIAPGTRAAMHLPGAGMMDMTFQGDSSIALNAHGQSHKIQADPGDEQPTSSWSQAPGSGQGVGVQILSPRPIHSLQF